MEAEYPHSTPLFPPRIHVRTPVFSSQLRLWSIIVCSTVLLILPFGSFSEVSPDFVVWVTALVILFLAVQSFRTSKLMEENPWTEPVSLLMTIYFFKYGFGALVVYYWEDFPWEAFPSFGTLLMVYSIKSNLPRACQLLLLGGMGLYLGASCPARRIGGWLPSLQWPIDYPKFMHNLVLYIPFALFIFIVGQWYLPVSIRFMVAIFGMSAWLLMAVASYRLFISNTVDRLPWLILLIFMYGSLFVLFLLTGMREHALKPIVMVGLGYILARGRLSLKFTLPAFVLIAFLISPWLSIFKSLSYAEQGISDRIIATSKELSLIPLGGRFELVLQGLVFRFVGSGPAFVSLYASYYPDTYPFALGQSFALELESLIPRVLWPEKPNLSLELNNYSIMVGVTPQSGGEDYGITSATFDAISEYYVNFGVAGVFIFSMLQGYWLRILYEWLVKRSNLEIGGSIYLAVFFMNHDFFGVVQVVVSLTRVLPVWLFLLYFMSRKVSPQTY